MRIRCELAEIAGQLYGTKCLSCSVLPVTSQKKLERKQFADAPATNAGGWGRGSVTFVHIGKGELNKPLSVVQKKR